MKRNIESAKLNSQTEILPTSSRTALFKKISSRFTLTFLTLIAASWQAINTEPIVSLDFPRSTVGHQKNTTTLPQVSPTDQDIENIKSVSNNSNSPPIIPIYRERITSADTVHACYSCPTCKRLNLWYKWPKDNHESVALSQQKIFERLETDLLKTSDPSDKAKYLKQMYHVTINCKHLHRLYMDKFEMYARQTGIEYIESAEVLNKVSNRERRKGKDKSKKKWKNKTWFNELHEVPEVEKAVELATLNKHREFQEYMHEKRHANLSR